MSFLLSPHYTRSGQLLTSKAFSIVDYQPEFATALGLFLESSLYLGTKTFCIQQQNNIIAFAARRRWLKWPIQRLILKLALTAITGIGIRCKFPRASCAWRNN